MTRSRELPDPSEGLPLNLPMFHRIAPALALLVLAPWVGEYLLGNLPLGMLVAIPFLVPLYGGGALLIREVARRTGRGWRTILLLGLAYGLVEAGLVDQSLFNPAFEGHAFQDVTPVPAFGISAYHAISFIIGHAVWSIGVPIAVVEILTPARRTVPWLGRRGLAVTAGLYLFGCWIVLQDHVANEQFLASPGQLAGAAVAALLLIVLAFADGKPSVPSGDRAVPQPGLLGLGTFVVASVFFARPEDWLGGVIGGLALPGMAFVLVVYWSRQRRWSIRHQVSLAGGALLTYAWGGFALTYIIRPEDGLAWTGNVLFAGVAVVLLIVMARSMRNAGLEERSREG